MSKNMTRKGLALGAVVALAITGFTALPASANGINDGSVSLLPNSGDEYNIIAGAAFELKSNMATGVTQSGRYLKFRVQDANRDVSVASGQYSVSGAAHGSVTVSGQNVTIPIANHLFKIGDVVEITGYTASPAINGTRTITSVVAGGSGSITFSLGATAQAPSASSSPTVKVAAETNRTADGTFVVDTKSATNTDDKVVRLTSSDKDATQTVVVTAWVDANDNGLVDSTEYASPARTVNFLASSAITPTVTFQPTSVGESTVRATVTFSPVLNGVQLTNGVSGTALDTVIEAVQVDFTRPGSAATVAAATVTYSNTTKAFTATSANMNAAGWNISQPIDTTLASTASITRNVATVTTNAAHGLQVGDRVVIASATTARLNSPTSGTAGLYSTVLSIPTTTSFTYAEQNADGTAATGADLAATTQIAGTVTILSGNARILRNFVVTGEYTARAKLYRFVATGTDELTNISSVVRTTVGATTAASASFAGVPNANTNLAGQVRVGTTTTSAVLTVLNADGNPVAAGVNVALTAQRTAGTSVITVNGTSVGSVSVDLNAVTDANGRVTVAITNATGAAGDVVRLTANAQGSTSGNFDVTWQSAVYSIVDLKDPSTISSPARNRAAEANGTYSFDLLVLDQFKSPAPATVRLLATITGRTTSTTPVTLTNGRATVNVVPDGSAVTGDTTVAMEFQTQNTSTGLWTTQDTAAFVDWAQAHNNDLAPVLIKFYSQTDRVTLNANGANLPSSTTAVRTANVTTLALKAVDLRTANDTNETYPTGARAVVSGNVTNSVTGVAKAGGVVTISGTGLLFKVGDVWALNTLTFIANDGTFAVDVYSRVSGQQTVTVASGSVNSTAVLTFNAVGGAGATGLTVNLVTPATAGPGTTFQVQGQVRDANGNPVVISTAGTGANPTLTVTYNGPGLVSGALPTTTNASGTFSFFVLLGSNDRGTATVVATYDADGTGTAAAAISKTNTITVGTSASGVSGTGKVNVGSFNGRLVVYAANLNGKRISWKVNGRWGSAVADSNFDSFNRPTSRAGVTVNVEVFVDGVSTLTKSVVTR